MKLKDGYKKLIGTSYNGDISLVLLSNGGNLGYAISSTASTLVLRNTNGLIESSIATSANLSPFKITSTYLNTNLNADLLDNYQANTLLEEFTSTAAKNLHLKIGGKEIDINDIYATFDAEGNNIVAKYVTLDTAQTITGLKTFLSNSSTTGVSLILKNKGWTGNMSTAMDFYNGSSYTVPNARIETKMVGDGKAGGTLIFYTQTKHTSTNPNPNGLTERLRIDDNGITKITGALTVTTSVTTPLVSSTGRLTLNATSTGVDLKFNNDNTKSVILNGTEFKPFDDANGKLDLGASDARWKVIYGGSGNFSGNVESIITTSDAVKHAVTNTNGSVELLVHSNRGLYDRTNSKWIIYVPNGTSNVYVPTWASRGSSTLPVYFNANGEPIACTAYSGLLTALSSSSATNLSITVGGTTKSISDMWATNIANKYHSRPTTIDPGVTGDGSMFLFKCTSSVTDTTTDPGDGHILHFNWDNNGKWDSQIYLDCGGTILKTRGMNGSGWNSWVTYLNTSNYTSIIGSGTYWKVNGLTTVGTGDIYLEMWRGANASWKMINNSGTLRFLCNYTSAAGSYYDALTVAYNTGNVWAKGSINGSYYTSRVATGTLPYACTSTTLNTNLNADMLDGYHASSFATSGHTHYYLVTPGDLRSTATTPNSYSNKFIFLGLKTSSTIGSPSSDTYSYLVGLRGWSDSSGGNSWELAFNNTGVYARNGATTSWGSWKKVAFTSDIPSIPVVTNYYWANVKVSSSSSTTTTPTFANTTINGTLTMGGGIKTASTPGTWVSGMSGAAILYNGLTAIDASSFWRFFNMKSSGGNVVCYGGLGNDIGFYGYYSGRTANGTDWRFTVSTANGNWTATASIYAAHFYENSDILLKTNILEILRSDNIPTIKEFDWKEDGSHSYGLIAQELEELGYPELVSLKDDGYKTVNYSAALSLIVGKLQVKIKELEKEIKILKNKN